MISPKSLIGEENPPTTTLWISTNSPLFSTNSVCRPCRPACTAFFFFFFKLLKRKKKGGQRDTKAPTRASTGFDLFSTTFPICLFFNPRVLHRQIRFSVDSTKAQCEKNQRVTTGNDLIHESTMFSLCVSFKLAPPPSPSPDLENDPVPASIRIKPTRRGSWRSPAAAGSAPERGCASQQRARHEPEAGRGPPKAGGRGGGVPPPGGGRPGEAYEGGTGAVRTRGQPIPGLSAAAPVRSA